MDVHGRHRALAALELLGRRTYYTTDAKSNIVRPEVLVLTARHARVGLVWCCLFVTYGTVLSERGADHLAIFCRLPSVALW